MLTIKSIKTDEDTRRHYPLYITFDNYLSQKYPERLACVCDEFAKVADRQPNKNMALAKIIEAFFDKKSYDFDFYHKSEVFHTNANGEMESFLGDNINVYKEYKYFVDGKPRIGYHQPNDKKVILMADDKMICQGCADLVEDMIDYCDKNYGFTIGHRKDGNAHHVWNILTIDGVEYKYDMSKCFYNQQTYFKPLTKEKSKKKIGMTIKKITHTNKPKIHISPSESYIDENSSSRRR